MDTFSRFCSETLRQESGSTVPKRDLIKTYEFWCSIEGGEHFNPAGFTQRMKQMGFKDGRSKNTRFWKDITLQDNDLNWSNDESWVESDRMKPMTANLGSFIIYFKNLKNLF